MQAVLDQGIIIISSSIWQIACDEGQPWDKDSVNGGDVGSKREYVKKKKRELRKRLHWGERQKTILGEDTFLQFKKSSSLG